MSKEKAKKPKGLTPAERAFCLSYTKTQNAAQSYMEAYPKSRGWLRNSVDVTAWKVLQRPHIKDHIAKIQCKVDAIAIERIAKTTAKIETDDLMSIADHMAELRKLRELAKELNQISAAVKAEELRGKVRRFYVEQVEHGGAGEFAKMTDAELDAEFRALAEECGFAMIGQGKPN